MSFEIERFNFRDSSVAKHERQQVMLQNWPVVYLLTNTNEVYVGESLNASLRMRQHLTSPAKAHFRVVRVILEETFNKSVCLDLESHLIRWFSGEGQYLVRNRNDGVTNANYYRRDDYRKTFEGIFKQLQESEHLFQRTIPEIENTELFKYSPFKSLTHDQAVAVEDILEGLFTDLTAEDRGPTPSDGRGPAPSRTDVFHDLTIIHGTAGTGKTVVAIYLLKLLCDIRDHDPKDAVDGDTLFSDFYLPGYRERLQGLRLGIVVPQQSLRKTINRVFKKIPGMQEIRVMTPFEVGESAENFDLLLVDEAHRLNQRANQPSANLNSRFAAINKTLFGEDLDSYTQLDWLQTKSCHCILLLDHAQTVRPADLPQSATLALVSEAQRNARFYPLQTQMRIRADEDYLGYIKSVLSNNPPNRTQTFQEYDLQLFHNFATMRRAIIDLNESFGLCRVIAGFAWKWTSKNDKSKFDMEIDGVRLQWNHTLVDWIGTANSINEMGSIHTVQGYDLNWAGVVIGPDLYFDEATQQVCFDRLSYADKKGRENNKRLGIKYTDEQLLNYVLNIYHVLLTRGMRGTYVYVHNPALRRHLARFIPGLEE